MLSRRHVVLGSAVLICGGAAGLVAPTALAHHGWTWAEGENFELTGTIKQAKLGNPHGLLTVAAKDGDWAVEVGQPWRNARAGLKDEMLAKGVKATFQGHRAQNGSRRMKAERIVINGKLYNLYPDRD
jgi:hypothetical protein